MMLLRRAFIASAAVALAAPCLAQADFTGKTITIVVGFPTGGDYDAYSRILASHMGRYLRGNPNIIVQNMPGASGAIAANYLAAAAPKDGATLGVVAQTVAIAQLTGAQGVRYDVGRFDWIGRMNANIEVQQVWHTSPVRTIADAKLREVVVAGTGNDSSSYVFPTLMNRMLGMKFKVVPGYQGVAMATLAMERGEVMGIARPWALSKTHHPEWMTEKKIITLVQYVLRRQRELPDVPAVVELGQDDMQKQILGLYASGGEIGRAVTAPPGVPAPVIEALRAAFSAAIRDERLLAEIRRSGLDFDPLEGAALQDYVAGVLRTPAEVVAAGRKLMREGE